MTSNLQNATMIRILSKDYLGKTVKPNNRPDLIHPSLTSKAQTHLFHQNNFPLSNLTH